jgi:hypothetical protein
MTAIRSFDGFLLSLRLHNDRIIFAIYYTGDPLRFDYFRILQTKLKFQSLPQTPLIENGTLTVNIINMSFLPDSSNLVINGTLKRNNKLLIINTN